MATTSSGDGLHTERKAAPGKFFAVVTAVDSAHNSESYASIAQTYSRHCVVWVDVDVEPNDWIEAHANGQVDQEGTHIMEIVQKLEVLNNGTWHEMSEETGVNVNARTDANIAAHMDRHHEDFSAYGMFDVKSLNLTAPKKILVGWCFRARESTTSAIVPRDSTRLVVKVYREFSAPTYP